jgi:SsrA-binding protein
MAKGHITTGRVAENRRARHEYEIQEQIEAGLVLMGSEVKSLRTGRVSIAESYAGEDRGRLMLFNANIPIYEPARENHEPRRPRELLVKTREQASGTDPARGNDACPAGTVFQRSGACENTDWACQGSAQAG